jgi:hypothetical protein
MMRRGLDQNKATLKILSRCYTHPREGRSHEVPGWLVRDNCTGASLVDRLARKGHKPAWGRFIICALSLRTRTRHDVIAARQRERYWHSKREASGIRKSRAQTSNGSRRLRLAGGPNGMWVLMTRRYHQAILCTASIFFSWTNLHVTRGGRNSPSGIVRGSRLATIELGQRGVNVPESADLILRSMLLE